MALIKYPNSIESSGTRRASAVWWVSLAALLLSTATFAQSTPDGFTFVTRTNVAMSAFITTEAVELAGFEGALSAQVVDGQLQVNGGSFGSANQMVRAGDRLSLRHVSAGSSATTTTTTLTVGTYSTSFRSTTTSQDRVPDAFSFETQTGVNAAAPVISAAVTPQGYDSAVQVVIGPGAEFSINDAPFTRSSSTLLPGQTLRLRHTANSSKLGYTKSSVKLGGVTGSFTTRTSNANSSAVAQAPHYLVYTARARSRTPPGSSNPGLLVLPSNQLDGTPTYVTQDRHFGRGLLRNPRLDAAGNFAGYQPFAFIFNTQNASGGDRFYKLLLDATKAPQAVPFSSAVFSTAEANRPCGAWTISPNLNDMSSTSLVYSMAGADAICETPDDGTFLVAIADSPSTAPRPLPLSANSFPTQSYTIIRRANGTASAYCAISAAQNFVCYPDLSFTNGNVIANNVSGSRTIYVGSGFELINLFFNDGQAAFFRIAGDGSTSARIQSNASFGGALVGSDFYSATLQFQLPTESAPGRVDYQISRVPTQQAAPLPTRVATASYDTPFFPNFFDVIGAIGNRLFVAYPQGDFETPRVVSIALDQANSQPQPLAFSADFLNAQRIVGNRLFLFAQQSDTTKLEVYDANGQLISRFNNTYASGFRRDYSGNSATSTYPVERISRFYVTTVAFESRQLQRLDPTSLRLTPVRDGRTGQPAVSDQNFTYGFVDAFGVTAVAGNGSAPRQDGVSQTDATALDTDNDVIYRVTDTPNTDEFER